MLLDSAQGAAVRRNGDLGGVRAQRGDFGVELVAGVDDGVDLVVGVAERDVVDRHAHPVVGNVVRGSPGRPPSALLAMTVQ